MDSYEVSRRFWPIVSEIEGRYQVEVQGHPDNPAQLMKFDWDNKATCISLNCELPWNERCPECGDLVPWEAYHFSHMSGEHAKMEL